MYTRKLCEWIHGQLVCCLKNLSLVNVLFVMKILIFRHWTRVNEFPCHLLKTYYLKREKCYRIEVSRKSLVYNVNVFRESRQNSTCGSLFEENHWLPHNVRQETTMKFLCSPNEAKHRHELAEDITDCCKLRKGKRDRF